MPLIVCRNVSKTYGQGHQAVQVLKGVNLTIKAGEFVAIVGPSGSGKSTLMHILGALDAPTSGTYMLNDHDTATLTEDELAHTRSQNIGFVFQAFNLLPQATVLRNVELPLAYAGIAPPERRERARQALLAVGLEEDRFYNTANHISGGQMQRVAVARALVNRPSVILADEPTGNLDQKTGQIVMETFAQLHHQGQTIILVTHDPAVAAHATRRIMIRDGEVVANETLRPATVAQELKV